MLGTRFRIDLRTMIVIFGWQKHGKLERPLLDTHCYRCQRQTTWDWHRVTEYVTLFFARVLPFKSESYLVCQFCSDTVTLVGEEASGVRRLSALPPEASRKLHDRLVIKIEEHQLAGKTQTQRAYLASRRKSDAEDQAR
jgi:hypothetical protein